MLVYLHVYIANEDEWFWVDRKAAKEVAKHKWVLEKRRMRLRAVINGHRWTLQHYVVELHKREYDQIYFLNGDKLDFRIQNLVPYDPLAYSAEFMRGSKKPKYRGVCLHKPSGLWQAIVGYRRKTKHLGYFNNAAEAAKVRKRYVDGLLGPVWAARMRNKPKRLPHKKYGKL